MASFAPYWDLHADSEFIQEGQDVFVKLTISKDNENSGDNYTLGEDEYLECTIFIQGLDNNSNSIDLDSHYVLSVGDEPSNLTPISTGITGNTHINGRHKVKLKTTSFYLPCIELTQPAYYFQLHCINDGTFTGTEHVEFNLSAVNKRHMGYISQSGNLNIIEQTISYDSKEIWVTPGVEIGDDKKLYCIGDIEYGADSTLFVQGFGRKRPFSSGTDDPVDLSSRVFFPAYRLLKIENSDLPDKNITDHVALIRPETSDWPINGINKEVNVNIQDESGKIVSTGLVFNPNGQFLQTFLLDTDPADVYFKVEIIDIMSTYKNTSEQYAVDQRYKAYQMWVCPDEPDDLIISLTDKPKAHHLYQLKDNVVYPYVIKGQYDSGVMKPVFESKDWNDLGYYEPSLGSGIIGDVKVFRFLMNATEGSNINIITDPDLGIIHVGEYFGHTVYPRIETNSTAQVSFELSGGDDIRKYGLDLTADGYIVGKAYALSSDFSANDDINLNFTISVYDTSGSTASQEFKLKIIRGFGENYLSSHLVPSVQFERDWFKCISTNAFVDQPFHRQSDNRYGLQKVPRMLLKENFVSQDYNFTTLDNLKKVLRESIIDTSGGAPVPDGKFKMVIGNYKIMSALDNQGNLLYDLLFREVHPAGTQVQVSTSPRKYSTIENGSLAEVFGLRQNIYSAIGEDVSNLIKDPTDLQNRGLYVTAISGLSDEMLDTVPRFMNHPFEDDGIKPNFMPIIPVAYCAPGKGEAFFNNLLQANEHGSMVGTEFEIVSVEFGYYEKNFNLYVPNKFQITLPNDNSGV